MRFFRFLPWLVNLFLSLRRKPDPLVREDQWELLPYDLKIDWYQKHRPELLDPPSKS